MKKSVCVIATLSFVVGALLLVVSLGQSITSNTVVEFGEVNSLFFPLFLVGLLICLVIFLAVVNNSGN